MRVTNCLRLAAAYTASRAWAVKRDHAPSQDSAGASLWTGKLGGLVSPMWDQCGIAPSTALNCASPLTGKAAKGPAQVAHCGSSQLCMADS